MLNHHKKLLASFISLFLIGCTTAEYQAKPIGSEATIDKAFAKDPTSDAFKQYLIKQGYAAHRLPLTIWGLDELTLCALFYHTKLDVTKKKLALAELAIRAAGIKKTLGIDAEIARSNQENGDIRPWSYGLSITIPIETANKREIKIEKAEKHAEAARMDVAETAWQLRHQIAVDLITFHQNQAETALLKETLAVNRYITRMLEKRVTAGIAAKTELSRINLQTLKTEHALNEKRAQFNLIRAKLAADVGLTAEKFASINIKPLALDKVLAQQAKTIHQSQTPKTLQREALLNRIDIRRSIANYAAAEAEIRLQAARQIPDITLSPGVLFDFGDSIWSLGFSSLLNTLNKNTIFIDKAKQLREIQGAEFEHLQSKVIAQLSQANVRYNTAKQTIQQVVNQQTKQQAHLQKMEKQFNAGLIGRLELKRFTLNNIVAKQQLLAAKFELLRAANQIENVLQKPLYTSFNIPQQTSEMQTQL